MIDKQFLEVALVCSFPVLLAFDHLFHKVMNVEKKQSYSIIKSKGIEGVRRLTWQQFEKLCGIYFERNGYKVKLCGLGGADGGMDLLLKKGRKRTLVQCKHWKNNVSVTTVREMFGVMCANNYDEVIIVALTGFTREAHEWAEGKPITLMTGADLIS